MKLVSSLLSITLFVLCRILSQVRRFVVLIGRGDLYFFHVHVSSSSSHSLAGVVSSDIDLWHKRLDRLVSFQKDSRLNPSHSNNPFRMTHRDRLVSFGRIRG